MTGCAKYNLECRFDFRINIDQMRTVERRAKMYSEAEGKKLYGIPAYPYVWKLEPEFQRLWLRMGYNEAGYEVIGLFRFEQGAFVAGVGIHVSVYIVENPNMPEWSGKPTTLVNYHLVAVNHFRGCLLGIPITSPVFLQTPPAPETNPPPPPPPDDPGEPLTV